MNTYKKLMPQIRGIVKSLENFNTSYTEEDYFQEAFLACLEAKEKYKKISNNKRTKMQPTVFAFMYIRKHLYTMAADSNEVVYQVYSPTGEYLKTMMNNEYRKKKKKLSEEGCTFKTIRIVESLYKTDSDGNEMEIPIEGDVNGGYEFAAFDNN